MKMYLQKLISRHWLYLAGAVTGAIAGYSYYHFIGCRDGSCAITSHPLRSTLYFALLGALVFGMFKRKETDKQTESPK